jgi:hypothetical protein
VTVFLQGLELRGDNNLRKRIYFSGVTPDLYKSMYGAKVTPFSTRLLDRTRNPHPRNSPAASLPIQTGQSQPLKQQTGHVVQVHTRSGTIATSVARCRSLVSAVSAEPSSSSLNCHDGGRNALVASITDLAGRA